MATLETHKANRAAAGAAYRAAAAAFVDAYVELKAYDLTLENNNVGGGVQPSFGGSSPVTVAIGHGEFLRDASSITGSVTERVQARLHQLLAS